MSTDPALDEENLRRGLRRLELTVTRRLDGLLQGHHLGLLPGTGSEWDTGREYEPGDDVRRMDWAVTARTNSPHVRDTTTDRELETWVLVDATASMDFGTAEMEKRELAAAALAAIGFLTTGGGNRLGAVLVNGPRVRRFPARAGRAALFGLLRAVLGAARGGAGQPSPSLADAVEELHRSARRRGLAVVVSDFLDGLPDQRPHGTVATLRDVRPAWEPALRRLAARQQVLAIEVTDPRELELPEVGVVTLVDPETGTRREISTDRRLRDEYARAAADQREVIRTALRRGGAHHFDLRTDRDWVRDIARHVLYQRRLARAAASARPAARSSQAGGAR
jgi:uncharacterized protein (DUF58 family)